MHQGRIAAVVLVLLLSSAGSAMATAADAITPLEEYTTAKARNLATTYKIQLVQFYEYVYNCLPWLGVVKNGIGFRQPRDAEADDRYLSVWISIDQKTDGPFGQMALDRRVSSMFSRYGVDMLRRLSQLSGVSSDPDVRGFSVVLSWLKPGGDEKHPMMETIALFIDKSSLLEYLSKQLPSTEFASRAMFNVFEGKDRVGRVKLDVWDDDFNSTFKLQNYEPPAGAKCS
jgi:hypothetical protein